MTHAGGLQPSNDSWLNDHLTRFSKLMITAVSLVPNCYLKQNHNSTPVSNSKAMNLNELPFLHRYSHTHKQQQFKYKRLLRTVR